MFCFVLLPDINLSRILSEKKYVDTLFWIHGNVVNSDELLLNDWLEQYRKIVNPKLRLVSLDLCATTALLDHQIIDENPLNLTLGGFSEKIFNCLSSWESQVWIILQSPYKLL